jgi:hypothetical protein
MDGMGHPAMALVAPLARAGNQKEFEDILGRLAVREEWCSPVKTGFSFPWKHDLFASDYTYAFFGGRTMITEFHQGWMGLPEYLAMDDGASQAYSTRLPRLPQNVEAP